MKYSENDPFVNVRVVKTINTNWKFQYFPSSEEKNDCIYQDYDDSLWQPVSIPHTWSTYETTGQLHPFIRDASEEDDPYWWYGWGWYRKHFIISSKHNSKKVFIEFDGVQKYARVWLNNNYIGEHKGGFTSFCMDITDYIKFDEDNLLAVEVSNRRDDKFGGIPPMTAGNWNVYGGIYRDVRIVIKNKIHIPFQGSADYEGGTHVTTPVVNNEKGNVKVITYVKNDGDTVQNCTVINYIVDADGKPIHTMESNQDVHPGVIVPFEQLSEDIVKPKLWSSEHPYLYTIYTTVICNGEVVDNYKSPLGFRWFHWDYEEKCLYLNGVKTHLHGTNRHQEYPWLGDAIPKWIHEMDLYDIKYNLGHNFLRTCHYPQDPYVYELCDRFGIIVCEEVPNIKDISFGNEIQKQNVIEMIRRDRNHPCILFWSMGNETNCAADGEWARREDPDRIIHYRHVVGRGSDEPHNHEQIEMENLLRCTIWGWYNSDVKNLEPEYGQHTGHEKWQHDMALLKDRSIRGHIYTNGAMWCYADHGADREYLNAPLKHVNPKGWVDAYRVPKLMYYLWQANWSSKPVIYIHPYDWTSRYIGTRRTITVNSNCDFVELKVNGISHGIKTPCRENHFTVCFENVLVEDGEITAAGMKDGERYITTLKMPGEPVKIKLSTTRKKIKADRADICLVKIDITDINDVHVYGARNDIYLDISGPGTLVGPSCYTTDIDKNNELEGTMYIDAPIYVPVRSTDVPGIIRLTASSPRLKNDTLEIVSIPCIDDSDADIIEPAVNEIRLELFTCEEKKLNEVSILKDAEKSNRIRVELFTQENMSKESDVLCENILKLIEQDIDFSSETIESYRRKLDRFIKNGNQGIKLWTYAYETLLDKLFQHLVRDRGILVADDYNFIVRSYNNCVRILEYIEDLDFDSCTKEKLISEYVDKIIKEGLIMVYSDEIERIRSFL